MQVCIRLMSPENKMLPGNLTIVIACLLEQKKNEWYEIYQVHASI